MTALLDRLAAGIVVAVVIALMVALWATQGWQAFAVLAAVCLLAWSLVRVGRNWD